MSLLTEQLATAPQELLAPAAPVGRPPKAAYAVVQEGGATGEIYVHVYDSRDDAEAFRVSCAEASYRTSDLIELPGGLAAHGDELHGVLEAVAAGAVNLAYAEPAEEPEEGMAP